MEKYSPYKLVWAFVLDCFVFGFFFKDNIMKPHRVLVENRLDSKTSGELDKDAWKTKFVICCFSIALIISTTYQTYLGFDFHAKTRVNTIYLNYLRKGEDSSRYQTPSPHLHSEPTACIIQEK